MSAALDSALGGERGIAKHRATAERRESLDTYLENAYPDLIEPEAATAAWARALSSPSVAAVLAHYEVARKVDSMLVAGKLDEAQRLARTAVSAPTKLDALPRLSFYRLRMAQGNTGKAMRNLEYALESPSAPLIVYEELAALERKLGRRAKAAAVLERAWRRFGKPLTVYPALIRALAEAGRRQQAERLALECAMRERRARAPCREALNGGP